jgi:hypothetical protein
MPNDVGSPQEYVHKVNLLLGYVPHPKYLSHKGQTIKLLVASHAEEFFELSAYAKPLFLKQVASHG